MKSALRCAHINKALRHFFPILNRVPRFSRPVRESLPLSEIEGWGTAEASVRLASQSSFYHRGHLGTEGGKSAAAFGIRVPSDLQGTSLDAAP